MEWEFNVCPGLWLQSF